MLLQVCLRSYSSSQMVTSLGLSIQLQSMRVVVWMGQVATKSEVLHGEGFTWAIYRTA